MDESPWDEERPHGFKSPYYRWSPVLLLTWTHHYFRGPYRGCSCSSCFSDWRRKTLSSESQRDRRRIADLETRIRKLEQKDN